MKKLIIFLFMFILINGVSADLYDNIKNIERNPGDYIIVIGSDAPSTDNLAASQLSLEFQKDGKVIDTKLTSDISFGGQNMILIGSPCKNPFVEKVEGFPKCSEWNYDNSVGMIKSVSMNGYKYIFIADSKDSRKTMSVVNSYNENKEELEKEEVFIIGTSSSDIKIIDVVPEELIIEKEEVEKKEIQDMLKEEITNESLEEVVEEKGEKGFFGKLFGWLFGWLK